MGVLCTILDEKGRKIVLKVVHLSGAKIDDIYIAISNKICPLPAHFFIKLPTAEIAFSTKLQWGDSTTFVNVYGLQKQYDENGIWLYNKVVGFGKSSFQFEPSIVEEAIEIHLNIDAETISLPLDLKTEECLNIELDHQPPQTITLKQNNDKFSQSGLMVFVQFRKLLILYFVRTSGSQHEVPFKLPSACNVTIRVAATTTQFRRDECCISTTTACSKEIKFKTYLTKGDIINLYSKAIKFWNRLEEPNFHPIRCIYRNKSQTYFLNILQKYGGLMRPYLKNYGGEQGSVLNGRIKGLFFSTMIDKITKLPPDFSYFGNVRLHIKAQYLFNPDCNLYFSDFYCHNTCHKVTLVLVPKSSQLNLFLQNYLLQLNIFENPYLIFSPNFYHGNMVLVNMDINVEIFYTESIDIPYILNHRLGFMTPTVTKGRGYALSSGIPKNPTCSICNLAD